MRLRIWRLVFLVSVVAVSMGGVWCGEARCERFSFVLDAPREREAEARLISGQLARVGIRADVRVWDRRALLTAVRQGNRTAFLTDWGSAFFDPADLAVPKLVTGGRGNFSGYSNSYLDALLTQGSAAPSPSVRRDSYQTAQRILRDQSPWVFGYILPRYDLVSGRVSGYAPALDERVNLHDVALDGGGPLVVDIADTHFRSFDPAAYRGRPTETLLRNLFDGLVTRTPDGEVVLEMAQSLDRESPTVYVFKLRPGMRFHDGSPVTAADVQFTFERILNPYGLDGRPSPRRGLLGPLEKVETLDARTVRFTLGKPYPTFLQALVHFQIVPRDYLQRVGEAGFLAHPVGVGPFKFVSGALDGDVALERFDGYYGGSPDLPPVGPALAERAVFHLEPDAGKRLRDVLDGRAHIMQHLPLKQVRELEGRKDVHLAYAAGTRSYELELNTLRPPFNDIRLRKAVAHAVDWSEILDKAYAGYGTQLATCFLPSGFGFDPQLAPVAYDPEASRQLLESLGLDTSPTR